MKVRKADVWPWVEAAFPEYTGRTFRVRATERVSFFDLNWGGGSRNQYVAVDLATRRVAHPAGASSPPWRNPVEGKTVDLPPGVVIVEHSFFQGKDMGITVHVNPADVPRLLPGGIAGTGRGMAGAALGSFGSDEPLHVVATRLIAEAAEAWRRAGGRVTRVKVVTGHTALARLLAEFDEEPIGSIPRQMQIPSPYAYSQTHTVERWRGMPVIRVETRQRRYEIFRVDGPIGPLDGFTGPADPRCPAGTVLHKPEGRCLPVRGRRFYGLAGDDRWETRLRDIAEKAFQSRDGRPVYSQIVDGPRVEHRSPASLFHAIRNSGRVEPVRTLMSITVHHAAR